MAENPNWRTRLKRLREAHRDGEEDEAAEMALVAAASVALAQPPTKKKGGSRPGRSANARRDHVAGHHRLYHDYFGSDPVYNTRLFRRRFRMPPRVFHRLMSGVLEEDNYFRQKPDALAMVLTRR